MASSIKKDRGSGFRGNFDLGECFCDVKCRHGHPTRLFNLGRGHYVACDTCRTYIFVGANLSSYWRQANLHVPRRLVMNARTPAELAEFVERKARVLA